jgi:hypothetical protein
VTADAPRDPEGAPVVASSGSDKRTESVAGPSPYAALRSEGDGAPRGEPSARRGVLGWVTNDLGLKVLALLLAFMLWNLARSRIDSHDEVLVEVTLVPPDPTIRVVGGPERGTVKLKLHGTRSEVERVKQALEHGGARISHRFTVDASDDGRIGPIDDPRRFSFPVEGAAYVVEEMPAVEARWVRVERRRLTFQKPEIEKTTRTDIDVDPPEFPDFPERMLEVEAPVTMFRGPRAIATVTPDPVSIQAFLDDPAGDPDLLTPFPFETGFTRWLRSVANPEDHLVTVTPDKVKGKVRVRVRRAGSLQSTVLLSAPDLDRYRDYDVEIKSTDYDAATRRLTLGVRGEPKVVEALRKAPGSWQFQILLPPPPAVGEPPGPPANVPVSLWFRDSAAPPAVRLVGDPHVFVTLRKRE